MFNANSHVGMDEFLSGINRINVVSLHTHIEDNQMGFQDSIIGGGDPAKIDRAILEATAGSNFCLTYRQHMHLCSYLTFIKVDDTGVFFREDNPGYSFADLEMTAKVVKEGTRVI